MFSENLIVFSNEILCSVISSGFHSFTRWNPDVVVYILLKALLIFITTVLYSSGSFINASLKFSISVVEWIGIGSNWISEDPFSVYLIVHGVSPVWCPFPSFISIPVSR